MPAFSRRLFLMAPGVSLLAAAYQWQQDSSSVALVRNGKTIWRFRYGAELSKPMFDPLALADGAVLTWNSPPDHPWHHALWFSWKYLNRVNYWEEEKQTGKSEGVTSWRDVRVTARPDFSARIGMELSYGEPGQPPLLAERRVIAVSAPDSAGTYHLDWSMTFTAQGKDVAIDRTPITGEREGVAYGGYAGLSIRLAREFREWKAVTARGPVTWDRAVPFHCEPGGVGIDFNGAVSGREAGVAFLDHPANLNSPTPWYIVMQPETDFAFSEAAVIYYRPRVLQAGQSLTLRYRVAVHEGRWSAGELATAQAAYIKEAKGKP